MPFCITAIRVAGVHRRASQGAAAAVWSEVEDLAVDHGIGLNPAESARAVANRLARATRLPDQERETLRRLVMQVESGWYAPPAEQAGHPPPSAGSADSGRPTAQPRATDTVTMIATPAGSESLWPAPTAIAEALDRDVPLSLIERLVPRSVRPAWWRE